MRNASILPILLLLAVSGMAQSSSPGPAAWSPAKSIGMFAYPKNQQNADQQLKDETECYSSAKQQSGVDPQAPPPAAPSAEQQKAAQEQAAKQAAGSTPKGGAVKGSAKGAAGGAAIGAIAGDAGTGAAIGATAGAVRGRRQQKKAQKASWTTSGPADRAGAAAIAGPSSSRASRSLRYLQEGVLGMHGCAWIFG